MVLEAHLSAVGSSILGPAGIVAGLSILIAYAPQIISFFQSWIDGAGQAEKAMKDLNDEAAKGTLTDEQYLQKLQQNTRSRLADVRDEIELTERKIEGTALSLASENYNREQLAALEKERDALIALDNTIIDGMENKAAVALATYEEAAAADAAARAIEEQAEAAKKLKKFNDDALKAYQDKRANEPLTAEEQDARLGDRVRDARDQLSFEDVGDGITDDIQEIEDYTDALEDLESALRMVGSAMAGMSEEQAMAWAKAQDDFENAKVSVNDVSGALVGAFESAASKGGNFIQGLATGILSAIGSLLIQEGTAYVALGIARNAALPGSGTNVIASGAALVAAGTGLKAAGSAIGSKGSGSKGGGGSSSSSSSGRNAQSVVQTKSDTANNAVMAVAKVKGQDLILAIQNADYSRRGYIPS